jgi:hypothetical protein
MEEEDLDVIIILDLIDGDASEVMESDIREELDIVLHGIKVEVGNAVYKIREAR